MSLVKPAPSYRGAFAIAPIIGVFMLIFGIHFHRLANESPSWPTTEGRITESEVRHSSGTGKGSNRDYAHVAYTYEVEGKRYTGDRVEFVAISGPLQGAHEVVRRYPVGRQVTVYYAPDAPIESVLEPGVTTASKVFPILGGVLCLFGGAGFLFSLKKGAKPQEVCQ